MSNQKTIDFFTKLLLERHADLKKVAEALILDLAGDNTESKKAAAQRVRIAAEALSAILPTSDTPKWLSNLLGYLSSYAQNHWTGAELMRNYYVLLPQILSHEWTFVGRENLALDFDGVFELYRAESRLPELFDIIVELLVDIKDSGAVDSVSMMDALAKVIATMQSGKSGSYFSLNGAWDFLLSFANNYLWAELAKIPVLGTVFESLKRTIDEADAEMIKLHGSIRQEMERRVQDEVRLITKPVFPHLTYGRQGAILEDKREPGTAIQV